MKSHYSGISYFSTYVFYLFTYFCGGHSWIRTVRTRWRAGTYLACPRPTTFLTNLIYVIPDFQSYLFLFCLLPCGMPLYSPYKHLTNILWNWLRDHVTHSYFFCLSFPILRGPSNRSLVLSVLSYNFVFLALHCLHCWDNFLSICNCSSPFFLLCSMENCLFFSWS